MTNLITPPASRLEEALRDWEMTFQIMEWTMLGKAVNRRALLPLISRPVVHWREFRKYLLNFRAGDVFDSYRFFDLKLLSDVGGLTLVFLPAALAAWTATSRRVFSISGDLQRLLAMTNVDNFTFGDVPWPFESFVVTFEQPLKLGENDAHCFDCMLITQKSATTICEPDEPLILQFFLFSNALSGFKSIPAEEAATVENLLSKQKWEKADRLVGRLYETYKAPQGSMYLQEFSTGWTPATSLAAALNTEAEVWMEKRPPYSVADLHAGVRLALHTVFAFMFYLTTLPTGSPHRRSIEQPPGRRESKLGPIHHGADVCAVTNSRLLPQAVREALDPRGTRSFTEISPHFRRGHMRKLPGFGHIPDAPKCVWVMPTFVLGNLLLPGTQPGGLQQEVH